MTPLAPVYVVDSSVAVKWYVERDEPDVGKALRFLEAYVEGRCHLKAPHLLVFEVANALTAARKLPAAVVQEALDHLRQLGIDLEDFRWSTLATAIQVATACDATIYDSYFLALALESESVFVTADNAFLRKVRRYPNVVSLHQLRLP